MNQGPSNQARLHYDRVTEAWGYLMGADFHYGYFDTPQSSLGVATARLTQLMVKYARIDRRHWVLDVGCGVGGPGMQLAEMFGCFVVGISTSEVGLAIARVHASQRGLAERIRFERRDALHSGLEGESFDRVWVMESSHLMEDKELLLQECKRVLRAGGRLVLCDVIVHREIPITEALRHAREFDILHAVFGRAKMCTLERYRAMCESAGLRIEHLIDISAETSPTLTRWLENARRHEGKIVKLLGQQGLDDFELACQILGKFWERRILGYGLLAAVKDVPHGDFEQRGPPGEARLNVHGATQDE